MNLPTTRENLGRPAGRQGLLLWHGFAENHTAAKQTVHHPRWLPCLHETSSITDDQWPVVLVP